MRQCLMIQNIPGNNKKKKPDSLHKRLGGYHIVISHPEFNYIHGFRGVILYAPVHRVCHWKPGSLNLDVLQGVRFQIVRRTEGTA